MLTIGSLKYGLRPPYVIQCIKLFALEFGHRKDIYK